MTITQGEHAQQGLMGVDVLVGGPALEELALLVEPERSAAEAVRRLRRQGAGGVDQHDVPGAGRAEDSPARRVATAQMGRAAPWTKALGAILLAVLAVVLVTYGVGDSREATRKDAAFEATRDDARRFTDAVVGNPRI
ncbi:hypothetical protein [Streptomyces flaveus]|uniref:hypothetical protein n=1 Tax=Streptomyces flaveus TaxID=66370 RepID=UPI00332243FE